MVASSLSSGPRLSTSDSTWRRWLPIAVLLGLALRVAAFALIHPSPSVEEESILSNRALLGDLAVEMPVDDQRAPASMFFYEFLARCFGPNRSILRLGNLVMSTLFLVVFFFWCRTIAPPRTAFAAVFLAAIHPELVFYSVSLWSEALYLLVAYGAFLLYLHWVDRPSLWSTALLGVAFGAVALVREIGIFLAVGIFLAWISKSKLSGLATARAAVFLAAFALTILPWSLSLSRRSGQVVLISGMNERRLYVGNVQFPNIDPGWRVAVRHRTALKSYWNLSNDALERRRLARHAAILSISEQLPWWPLKKAWYELPKLFSPNSFPAGRLLAHPEDPRWAGKWAYRFSTDSVDRHTAGSFLAAWTIAFHAGTLLLGAAGLALFPLGRAAIPILGFATAHLLPPLVTTACSRYRIPLTPILLLGAAALLVQGGTVWNGASRRRRILAAAGVVLAGAMLLSRAGFVLPAQYG
jgi:hypothetical protein